MDLIIDNKKRMNKEEEKMEYLLEQETYECIRYNGVIMKCILKISKCLQITLKELNLLPLFIKFD